MSKPRPKSSSRPSSPSSSTARKPAPRKSAGAGKPTGAGKPAGSGKVSGSGKPAFGGKPKSGKPSSSSSKTGTKPKSVNPFGEKKRPAGKKFGGKGPKDFKRRRPEEDLDIQLTDKELGEVTTIKRKLAEIREYKKILAEDGLKPDQQDKERESALIVRLLRIEKNAKMAARQRAKAAKTEAFREAAEKAEFAKQKKKSREDRFSDDDDSGDDDYRSRRSYDDDDGDDW